MFPFLIVPLIAEQNPMRGNNPLIVQPPVKRNYNCKAPHTRRSNDKSGKCECVEGYPFGNPSLSTGCYKCRSECVKNSKCIFPGLCKCDPGYVGDGFFSCQVVAPMLIAISPDNAFSLETFTPNVTFVPINGSNFTTAYLRMRDTITKCVRATEDVFNCSSLRLGKPGVVEVELSFDNRTWSREYVEFIVNMPEIGDYIIYLFIIIVGISITLYITRTKKKMINPRAFIK